MPEQDGQSAPPEDQTHDTEPETEEQLVEDLEPEEAEATNVQGGGFRVRGGRGRA